MLSRGRFSAGSLLKTKMEDQLYSETLYEKWLKQHRDKQAFDYNPESKFLYYNLVVSIIKRGKWYIDVNKNEE